MWSRAKKVTRALAVAPFEWDGTRSAPLAIEAPKELDIDTRAELERVEREAFARGVARGERAAAEAVDGQGTALLRRLMEAMETVPALRAETLRRTERQVVELALTVARHLIHREVSLDRDVLVSMARTALKRLGESATMTIRLHPEEYATIGAEGLGSQKGRGVSVVADPHVGLGGCRVEADVGTLDVGVDAQIQEIAQTLFEGEPTSQNSIAITPEVLLETGADTSAEMSAEASAEGDPQADTKSTVERPAESSTEAKTEEETEMSTAASAAASAQVGEAARAA